MCQPLRAQVLSRLLVLACDASGGVASAAQRAQQSLTVFFHAFASAGGGPRLSAAALPAARRALRLGASPAKSPAPQLLRYVLSLLQVCAFIGSAPHQPAMHQR